MDVDPRLIDVLRRAQHLGDLGDRPVDEVVGHARSFVEALEDVTGRVLDLGSGAGIPGLVIAHDRPDLEVVLLDRRTRRTDALDRAVRRLGWTERVRVVASDAEDHLRRFGGSYSAAVARGFGPPVDTLRVGVRAVLPGGRVVISEPPPRDSGTADRWDQEVVRMLSAVRLPSAPRVAAFERRR